MTRVYERTPVIDRIVAKCIELDTGCWLWTGAVGSSGYGHISVPDGPPKSVSTHRTAWEHHNGPIPDGLVIDHLCGVLRCCNPEHLEPVTNAENQRRRAAKRDTCAHGHLYTDANTRLGQSGRECRTCAALRERQRRSRTLNTPCPRNARHWFAYYGWPGSSAPICRRCEWPNPKYDAHRDPYV